MAKANIKDPVIIIGCPRSGTTMLFTILSQSKELFSLYRESWNVIRGAYDNGMLPVDVEDDVIEASVVTDEVKEYLRDQFHKFTTNHPLQSFFVANHYKLPGLSSYLPIPNPLVSVFKGMNAMGKNMSFDNYRIVEKTPRNCFRVGFMHKLFPDAKFIFISRNGKTNVSSLIEGWKRNASRLNHKRFPDLKDSFEMSNFDYKKWEYVLPPGWKEFYGKTLEETCAHQWVQSNKYALEDLAQVPAENVYKIKYEDLTGNPADTIKGIANFVDIPFEGALKAFAEKPPVVSTSFNDKPRADKWKKNEEALNRVAPMMEEMMQKLDYAQAEAVLG